MKDLLPLSIPTRDHLPADLKPRYKQTLAGDWRLQYVSTDSPEFLHYNREIAAGELDALPPGVTPETLAQARLEQEAGNAAAQAEFAKLVEADAAKRRARIDAEEAKRRAAFDAREEKRRREERAAIARGR